MKLNCVIVEDEPLARNLLTEYVRKVPSLNLIEACSSPIIALEVLRNNPIDVLFLDVQMPGLTGFEVASHTARELHPIRIAAGDPAVELERWADWAGAAANARNCCAVA